MRSSNTAHIVDHLAQLGFSQYEAKAYLGLLSAEAQTGYSLSKVTTVPQPKVYETLRRLVDRGAAIQISDDPAKFVAIPWDELLSDIETDFQWRVSRVREDLGRLGPPQAAELPLAGVRLESLDSVQQRAIELIETARAKVYLSGKSADLTFLKRPMLEASRRGVVFIMLYFGGNAPFAVPGGASFAHVSTAGRIYRRHQAKHLAVVTDGEKAVWALARDGRWWHGMYVADRLFAAALKTYVRHDIYLQRIFGDFGDELRPLYGEDFAGLTDLSVTELGDSVDGLPEESGVAEDFPSEESTLTG